MDIAILGGGSFGMALAIHLARNGSNIRVWEFVEENAQEMQEKRVCKLLGGVSIPDNIIISSNMKETLITSSLVLLVVPSSKVESTMEKASQSLGEQPIIICSKGFASGLRLLSEVVDEHASGSIYCLYGPTHAEEICKGMFSGIVLAGEENKDDYKKVIESENLKVDLSGDIIGVQVSAALKNILAVFIGILHGMGLGDNAKAYFMTKGLEEIKQIGLKWGGQEETFYGLAGLGDVIVTCTSEHSRNRHVGEEIGKGRKLTDVLKEMEMVAEGVTTVKEAMALQERFDIELPIISALFEILFEAKDPKTVLQKLSI